MFTRLVFAAAAAVAVSGCATIIEGSSQAIAIDTTPPGASCSVEREGQQISSIASTPGSAHVDKSKNDITVTCNKPGYREAKMSYSPKFNGTTFGNIIAGGVIGVAVDASTGANYEYPNQVSITLTPLGAPVPAPTPAPGS